MKEYVRGALQSLVWARMILSNVKAIEDLDKALSQIDKAVEKLRGPEAEAYLKKMKEKP